MTKLENVEFQTDYYHPTTMPSFLLVFLGTPVTLSLQHTWLFAPPFPFPAGL